MSRVPSRWAVVVCQMRYDSSDDVMISDPSAENIAKPSLLSSMRTLPRRAMAPAGNRSPYRSTRSSSGVDETFFVVVVSVGQADFGFSSEQDVATRNAAMRKGRKPCIRAILYSMRRRRPPRALRDAKHQVCVVLVKLVLRQRIGLERFLQLGALLVVLRPGNRPAWADTPMRLRAPPEGLFRRYRDK